MAINAKQDQRVLQGGHACVAGGPRHLHVHLAVMKYGNAHTLNYMYSAVIQADLYGYYGNSPFVFVCLKPKNLTHELILNRTFLCNQK